MASVFTELTLRTKQDCYVLVLLVYLSSLQGTIEINCWHQIQVLKVNAVKRHRETPQKSLQQ